jgi:hypothetical protein
MNPKIVDVARQFGCNPVSVESLTEGLIHQTYKATTVDGITIILQQVNTSVFKEPDLIINNYAIINDHLNKKGLLKIPSPRKTLDNKNSSIDEHGVFWRAFQFIHNTSTETTPSVQKIFSAAVCYGQFTKSLIDLDITKLSPTITDFHNLNFRYRQLRDAISQASPDRLKRAAQLLAVTEEKKSLVSFYNNLSTNNEFKLRAMHHDAKLSNILFDRTSGHATCPIDLDTTMPGYFFSDLGDMVRSMTPDVQEDTSTKSIAIRKDYYQAILDGYLSDMGDVFTQTEKTFIHHAGPMMVYMQAIRFLADYLSNDVYYKISYSDQNFDRAVNQFMLLQKLEEFLASEYNYEIK